MICRQYLVVILLTAFASLSECSERQEHDERISETITLRVVEIGQGQPVIFVHGSVGDHTVWHDHLPVFAKNGYRAIAYSRRYNWPNKNTLEPNHSAIVEAEDLEQLSKALNLTEFHLVGHSYGGYTALLYTLDHPAKVTSLTLAEPPIVPWLKEVTGEHSAAALAHYRKLYEEFIIPARQHFNVGNDDQALRVFLDVVAFKDAIDRLPRADVDVCRRNIAELQALVESHNCYPLIGKASLRANPVPVLLISGRDSSDVGKYTDPYLLKLLPKNCCERIIIPGANHIMWKTKPKQTNRAVLDFIGRHDTSDR